MPVNIYTKFYGNLASSCRGIKVVKCMHVQTN